MEILPVFCDIDDFCLLFEPLWKQRLLSTGARQRDRAVRLCLSEVMTIIVLFHASSYRNFEAELEHPCQRAIAAAGVGILSSHMSNSREREAERVPASVGGRV